MSNWVDSAQDREYWGGLVNYHRLTIETFKGMLREYNGVIHVTCRVTMKHYTCNCCPIVITCKDNVANFRTRSKNTHIFLAISFRAADSYLVN